MYLTYEFYSDFYHELQKSQSIDMCLEKAPDIISSIESLSNDPSKLDTKLLELIIRINLLIYDQSETGKVIMNDSKYDALTSELFKRSGKRITTVETTETLSKKWEMVKHPNPGLVGSIDKVYDKDALYQWLDKLCMKAKYDPFVVIRPKFDGISSVVYMEYGEIKLAMTRKDGIIGQNITQLIRAIPAKNKAGLFRVSGRYALDSGDFVYKERTEIKTEILMTQDDFEQLSQDYPGLYANRRSAVSGIINTPSNKHLAKYLTIEPLVYMEDGDPWICGDRMILEVIPDQYGDIYYAIQELIAKYKDSRFQYRVDGVVLYPSDIEGVIITEWDESDILADSIAYKTNSAYGVTRALEVYPSVGRTGQVTPMLKVEPVEVNETIVTDVSLSTMKKFMQFNLHHLEKVQIESAGDVIPMVKGTLNPKEYPENAPLLTMKDKCPYCGSTFEPISKELIGCVNDECPNRQAGIVTNFLAKMGIQGMKDATIVTLQEAGLLKSFPEIIHFIKDKNLHRRVAEIEGFSNVSVNNMVTELRKLIENEFTESQFLGSLGIQNVSINTAGTITRKHSIGQLLTMDISVLLDTLMSIDGIGEITAVMVSDYLNDNRDMIRNLMNEITIVPDREIIGKVVFTGFDSEEMKQRLEAKGYLVPDNLTKDTNYLIAAKMGSGKCQKAEKYGIPIIPLMEADDFINSL